jgi:hypothetical protein
VFLFLTVWVLAGIGAAVVLIMDDFNVDLTEVVRGLVSWMVLTIGLAVVPTWLSNLFTVELFLDPVRDVFWQKTRLPIGFFSPFRNHSLASGNSQLAQYGGCTNPRWFRSSSW